jgi:protein-S-isoprenylcysteine O-methyltransferase Ste14
LSQPALIALSIATVALTVAALFSSGHIGSGEREDRSNRWVIAAVTLIGLLLAYLPAYTDRKDVWTLDGDTVRWLGVVLFAAGGALRLWPVFVLGRRFSGLVAPSSRGTNWSPAASMVSSVTPAISACSSTHSGGRWPFARASACC